MKALNSKAKRLDHAPKAGEDVIGMQHVPGSCATVFDPGWELTAWGGVNGMCAPMEADILGCSAPCWWPAQVPDTMVSSANWVKACSGPIAEDWRALHAEYRGMTKDGK